jgi:hypothetical protein
MMRETIITIPTLTPLISHGSPRVTCECDCRVRTEVCPPPGEVFLSCTSLPAWGVAEGVVAATGTWTVQVCVVVPIVCFCLSVDSALTTLRSASGLAENK